MRLVTWNVRYFGHRLKGLASTAGAKQGIARVLSSLEPLPEVIALQEVETLSLRSRVALRGAPPDETQLEGFLRHLGEVFRAQGRPMPWRAFYFPAHAYRLGALSLYTTGLAVLIDPSRVEVLAGNSDRPHSVTFHRGERLKALKQTRIAAHLHLADRHGQALHLFNTHLSLPTPWAREFWSQPQKMGHGVNQVAEATRVLEYAQHVSRREPFVVVGDFNAAPGTPVYQAMRAGGLQGAQAQLGLIDEADPRGFSTAGFLALRMHLDHVFGSPGVTFTDMAGTHRFGDPASPFHGWSDHVPLLANLAY